MSSYKKLGLDVLLMTIGSFSSKLLTFLFVPFYTAMLSPTEYGTADLITITVTLLFPLFTLIICEAMMRFALDHSNDQAQVYAVGWLVWGIGTIAFLLCSPILFLFSTLRNYYWFVLLYYISYSLYNNLSYFMRGINKVKQYALGGTLCSLCIIILNLFFLLVLKIGLIGYLLSYIISNFIVSVFFILSGKLYCYKFSFFRADKKLTKAMLYYSLPMLPNSLSWWISNSSDKYILTVFAGVSVTGIYSVAYKIPTILSTVSTIIMSAWRLASVSEFGSKKTTLFFEDILSKFTMLMLCLSTVLMTGNKILSSLLYSNLFYQAWKYVPILLVASMFHGYSDFLGSIYTASMKTKWLFISTGIGAVTNIMFNFVLIPHFAALGAALATMVSYGIVWMVRLLHSRTILKLVYQVKRDLLCHILIFIQLFVTSNSFRYEFLISGLISCFVFFLMRKEIEDLLHMICKIIFHKKQIEIL